MKSVSIVTQKHKFDGSIITVAEAVVGDETGITKMVFRNGKETA